MPDFLMRRWDLEPYDGYQAPPHVHHASDEGFCVLAGSLVVVVGAERHVLGPGDHVVVPAGTVHTFATQGDEPIQVVGVVTPEIDGLIAALMGDARTDPAVWARFRSALAELPG